ncbi:hypothetical protein [Candidatus Pelagibacter sp.]|uniref:hypothetical protein n=1 Tax=Candidatus Pelagibacter sp. TaxID=2024849 RepID=UPI003F86C598
MLLIFNLRIIYIIIIFILIFISISFADEKCNKNRQDWIKQLKIDLSKELGDIVYSDNKCFIEVIEHNGISVKDHMYRISGEKRDTFKDLEKRKTRELLNEILQIKE